MTRFRHLHRLHRLCLRPVSVRPVSVRVAPIAALLTLAVVAGAEGCGAPPPEAPFGGALQGVLGVDNFLYFRSNASGWGIDDATRVRPTADPYVFTLDYDVTQTWMLDGGDQAIFTETNQQNGWGTAQAFYARRDGGVLAVPGGDYLVTSWSNFAIRYRALGRYRVTVNWRQGTFAIDATPGGPPPPQVDPWLPGGGGGAVSTIARGHSFGCGAIANGWSGYAVVGMANGDLYRTWDGRSARPWWQKIDEWTDNAGVRQDLFNLMVSAIAIHPCDQNAMLVSFPGVQQGTKAFRTSDGGQRWERVYPPFEIWGLSYNPKNPAKVYAVGLGNQVAESMDGGATWQLAPQPDPYAPPLAAGARISAVAMLRDNDPKQVVVGASDGSAYLTFDGASWIRLGPGVLPAGRAVTRVTTNSRLEPPEIYLTYGGMLNDSVWASRNGGQHWLNVHNPSLPTTSVVAIPLGIFGVSVHPASDSTVFLDLSYSTWRSTDRGGSWTRTSN